MQKEKVSKPKKSELYKVTAQKKIILWTNSYYKDSVEKIRTASVRRLRGGAT